MISLEPLVDAPLFSVADFPADDNNINGPSLIRVPEWVERPLGRYYLYFASHTGRAIQMAYADELTGPWRFYEGGVLSLADSLFATEPPNVMDLHPIAKGMIYAGLDDFYPHIASPDVVVDGKTRTIRLYYHGRTLNGLQLSRVAVSADGVSFTPQEPLIGRPYVRAFRFDGWWYALGMPGYLFRSRSGLGDWQHGPNLFPETSVRHTALLCRGQTLFVFWSQIGDRPERIKLSTVDLSPLWHYWALSDETLEVRRPERPWEGAAYPLEPSHAGAVFQPVNQLRDPAVFVEDGVVYLAYAIAGEHGIAIGRLQGL